MENFWYEVPIYSNKQNHTGVHQLNYILRKFHIKLKSYLQFTLFRFYSAKLGLYSLLGRSPLQRFWVESKFNYCYFLPENLLTKYVKLIARSFWKIVVFLKLFQHTNPRFRRKWRYFSIMTAHIDQILPNKCE